jgi:CRP-like cAMP-binding protein
MASIDTEYLGRIVARLIERVPLFKGLTQAALLAFLNSSRLEEVGAGGTVFREGDRSSSIFVILRGSVEATRDIYENVGATVCVLEAGACFGEMALADRLPRSASVKARENSLLCALSVDAINDVPEVAKVIYTTRDQSGIVVHKSAY